MWIEVIKIINLETFFYTGIIKILIILHYAFEYLFSLNFMVYFLKKLTIEKFLFWQNNNCDTNDSPMKENSTSFLLIIIKFQINYF